MDCLIVDGKIKLTSLLAFIPDNISNIWKGATLKGFKYE